MDIVQVITIFAIVATNIGTVIALYMHSDKKMEENRKETSEILRGMQQDSATFQKAMMQESKDFHSRLCIIEERNRK